jgi:hypothetical protein
MTRGRPTGWSHRLLWGVSVDISRTAAPRVATSPVTVASPTGAVTAGSGRDLALTLRDGADVRAVNALLDLGIKLHRTDTDAATVVVPASARSAAEVMADRFGVRFTAAPRGPQGTPFTMPAIAGAVAADELFALREMGFEVRTVSTALLNAGADLSDVDTLVVSSGLSYGQLNATGKAEVDELLARGGVVTRGATGAAFNAVAGLLPATAVAGRGDANGVVAVENTGVVVGAGSLPHSFVYSPALVHRHWFHGRAAVRRRPVDRRALAAERTRCRRPGAGGGPGVGGLGCDGARRQGGPVRHRAAIPGPPQGAVRRVRPRAVLVRDVRATR